MEKRKHLFKIIIVGNSSVGKTSLLQQFVNKQFSMAYKATVGADFLAKQMEVDGETVTLQIWDTAGQERFKSVGGAFYKGSDCCVIVYDVTDRESITMWKQIFQENCRLKDKQTFPFVIIGNKIDMKQRKVSEQEGRKWEQNKNISYFQTSALQSFGVEKAFKGIGRAALKNTNSDFVIVPQSVNLNKKIIKPQKKNCRC